jgi:hypothetical protein
LGMAHPMKPLLQSCNPTELGRPYLTWRQLETRLLYDFGAAAL